MTFVVAHENSSKFVQAGSSSPLKFFTPTTVHSCSPMPPRALAPRPITCHCLSPFTFTFTFTSFVGFTTGTGDAAVYWSRLWRVRIRCLTLLPCHTAPATTGSRFSPVCFAVLSYGSNGYLTGSYHRPVAPPSRVFLLASPYVFFSLTCTTHN